MMVIYKYRVPMENTTASFPIDMPDGATILSVQVQYGVPCIWALVNASNPRVTRRFTFITTGEEFNDRNLLYVATVQSPSGDVVLHLFEVMI